MIISTQSNSDLTPTNYNTLTGYDSYFPIYNFSDKIDKIIEICSKESEIEYMKTGWNIHRKFDITKKQVLKNHKLVIRNQLPRKMRVD